MNAYCTTKKDWHRKNLFSFHEEPPKFFCPARVGWTVSKSDVHLIPGHTNRSQQFRARWASFQSGRLTVLSRSRLVERGQLPDNLLGHGSQMQRDEGYVHPSAARTIQQCSVRPHVAIPDH